MAERGIEVNKGREQVNTYADQIFERLIKSIANTRNLHLIDKVFSAIFSII